MKRQSLSCPTLCDPIDSSPPGSPVSGIPQARTLEWVSKHPMRVKPLGKKHDPFSSSKSKDQNDKPRLLPSPSSDIETKQNVCL